MANDNIVIIGAGLSGALMYSVLNKKAKVLEKRPKSTSSHRAVMHFRNPDIGRLLDIRLKKVNVTKAIYYKGKYYTNSDIFFSNLYSQKTLGILSERSISDLGDKERWINYSDEPIDHYIDEKDIERETIVGSITPGVICHADPKFFGNCSKERYDYAISTMPLPLLLKCLGEETTCEFKYDEIYVYRGKFSEGFSSVCQTLYFPDPDQPVYRATIDEDVIIIESTRNLAPYHLNGILINFGIDEIVEFEEFHQPMGKIKPLPDNIRKSILYDITSRYNIYCLGRFGIWANVRSDDIYKDALKIKAMIETPDLARKYMIHKENTHV